MSQMKLLSLKGKLKLKQRRFRKLYEPRASYGCGWTMLIELCPELGLLKTEIDTLHEEISELTI